MHRDFFLRAFRPRIDAVLMTTLLSALCFLPALALGGDESSAIDPTGRPKDFREGTKTCIAVWFENGAWHIRATTRGHGGPHANREAFDGTVTLTAAGITHGDLQGLEGSDDAKIDGTGNSKAKHKKKRRGKNEDGVDVRDDDREFSFHFVDFGKTDGLNFHVSERAETITFKLLIGGDDNPKQIEIGQNGAHPDKVPFTLPARPDKAK